MTSRGSAQFSQDYVKIGIRVRGTAAETGRRNSLLFIFVSGKSTVCEIPHSLQLLLPQIVLQPLLNT